MTIDASALSGESGSEGAAGAGAGTGAAGAEGSGAGAGGVGAEGAGTGAGAEGSTAAGGGDKPWYDGASEEVSGYIQNKGWKDPLELVAGYQNLEKLRGVPEDQLAQIPGPDDKDAWDALHNKLGRPEKAEDYKVEMPAEGGDKELAEWFKGAAHEAGLSQRQAAALVPLWNAEMVRQGEAQGAASEQAGVESMKALKTDWGTDWDKNHANADQAIHMLGVKAETLEAFRSAGLAADALALFANIGKRIQEDSFEGAGEGGSQFGKTPEGAKAEIAGLKIDPDFMAAYGSSQKPGHKEAVERMTRLNQIAYPG